MQQHILGLAVLSLLARGVVVHPLADHVGIESKERVGVRVLDQVHIFVVGIDFGVVSIASHIVSADGVGGSDAGNWGCFECDVGFRQLPYRQLLAGAMLDILAVMVIENEALNAVSVLVDLVQDKVKFKIRESEVIL